MNYNERDMYQSTSLELLLEKKIQQFFNNPEYDVKIFHVYLAKNTKSNKQLEIVESLIPIIHENISTGYLKRALKLLVALDVLMESVKES